MLPRASKLTLPTTDNGQYDHGAATTFIAGIHRVLRETYNPGDPATACSNSAPPPRVASIKATSVAAAKSVLDDAEATAAAASTGSTIRAPTHKTADRINLINQASSGPKRAPRAITAKVGSDVTDAVLKTADGSDLRSIDDWLLEEVLAAVVQGADRPNSSDVLAQLLHVIQFKFDFRKKVSANMELLRAKAGRMTAYGITVDDSQLALVLLANIDIASSHDWGREFCPTLQTIRRRFAYNHAHNAATVTAILKELAGADGVHKLNDAPAPTGTANAVSNQVSLLTQLLQQQHDASDTDHTEAASAVQTDSDSSTKHNNRQHDRGRDNERNNRRGSRRGGQRGTQRSNSRHPPNPCPHCKKFARRKPHPKTPEDRCFWNKRYKGYRGKWICNEMELAYVPRHKFAADMGGYPNPPHTSPKPIKQQFNLSPKQLPPTPIPSNFKHKAQRKALERQARRLRLLNEATLLDRHISWAEDEQTAKAKANTTSKQRRAIGTAHTIHPREQQQLPIGQALATTIRCTLNNLFTNRHVRFAAHTQIRHFDSQATTPLITFDSGADSHYLSKTDRLAVGLPILRSSTRQVGVANGSTSTAKYVSQLPFPQLSPNAVLADSFVDFPQSLMSVGKTCDDGTVAIFTQSGVTVHKDADVLITCQGKPLLIGARDAHGRYRIPLTQHKGWWQPQRPSKKARQTLRHANSVYDLPSTEQAIRWMHASTWLKAVQAGNFIGWPLLTSRNIQKYFPETVETPKGHLNQSRTPMGCSVQVHEKSDARGTWAFHSIDGWYLSTSPEHYRTHRCHIKSTNSERLSDTAVFQHKSITHPSLTPTDKLMQAVSACAAALKGITAPTKGHHRPQSTTRHHRNHLTHLQQYSKGAHDQHHAQPSKGAAN
eukprot:CCRYP_011862-RA/>CCRYP_011862-RA protein AED:0.33 eAED:0.33 QI:0/0/0/1/0.66/0.75/4/0/887